MAKSQYAVIVEDHIRCPNALYLKTKRKILRAKHKMHDAMKKTWWGSK
jgi:hypothetical protein